MLKGKTVIVEVTKTEFKTKDGRVVPHLIPFEEGQVPTAEELQEQYNYWEQILKQKEKEEHE